MRRRLAVLLIDLDGFKEINDALGHHAGDLVLQEVATRLRSTLRASDTVARLGGDEFAVLLPATDVNRAELAARKVLHDLQHPFVADGRPLLVSASIGIAAVPWHAATGDEAAAARPTSAMYLAKSDKTGYVVYNPNRDRRAQQPRQPGLVDAAGDRRAAIRARLPADRCTSAPTPCSRVESLVRWNHPEHGRLLPDDFIRVAEHTGLVNPLTSFVLESALQRMAALDAPGRLRDRGQHLAAEPASFGVPRRGSANCSTRTACRRRRSRSRSPRTW